MGRESSEAILAQTTRYHATAVGDSSVRHTLLEVQKLESIAITRSQIGVCHPTLRDCHNDPSGPLLYGFSR